ncbi:hypothetical protein BDQ17DRAFT_1433863 [Cyathus striatus]|nr:hypothetical protein BDQ17DRAFT_1433863 [Cyathus striatus]
MLIDNKVPSLEVMENMLYYGLVVKKDANGNDIEYNEGWSAEEVDHWFRGLLRKPLNWLDKYSVPADGKLWSLLKKDHSTMTCIQILVLSLHKHSLNQKIPNHIYEDFNAALQDNSYITISDDENNSLSQLESPKRASTPSRRLHLHRKAIVLSDNEDDSLSQLKSPSKHQHLPGARINMKRSMQHIVVVVSNSDMVAMSSLSDSDSLPDALWESPQFESAAHSTAVTKGTVFRAGSDDEHKQLEVREDIIDIDNNSNLNPDIPNTPDTTVELSLAFQWNQRARSKTDAYSSDYDFWGLLEPDASPSLPAAHSTDMAVAEQAATMQHSQ